MMTIIRQRPRPLLATSSVALGNPPKLRAVMHLTYAMVDVRCTNYLGSPRAVTLDIDDTVD